MLAAHFQQHFSPGSGGACYERAGHLTPTPLLRLCCEPAVPPTDLRWLCGKLERLLDGQVASGDAAAAAPTGADGVGVLRMTLDETLAVGGDSSFAAQWSKGMPVVVSGLLTPEGASQFSLRVLIADELSNKKRGYFVTANRDRGRPPGQFVHASFQEFTNGYYRGVKKGSPVLRVKDLPDTKRFAEMYPTQYATLQLMMGRVPFCDKHMFGGPLNVAAHMPTRDIPPDLGPKVYCSHAGGETCLHLDIADAVNVMTEVVPKNATVGARWHMWRVGDQEAVRAKLRRPRQGTWPRAQAHPCGVRRCGSISS